MIKVLGSSSQGNCYIIQAGEDKLILDAGISEKEILKGLNFNLRGVKGCLLTHNHMDHSKSIKKLIDKGIDVYTVLPVTKELDIGNSYRLFNIEPLEWNSIGNFLVMALPLQHTNSDNNYCPCVGFYVSHKDLGSLVYITDTEYCQYKLDNVDHILIECNYSEKTINDEEFRQRTLKSHMSLETCKKSLETWDTTSTKDITLIHLSNENSDEEYFKKEIEDLTLCKVYIGKKGLVID